MWWISQPLLDGAESRDVWISTQVEELDERMKKLTHKLENARRDFVRSATSDAYAATPSTLGGDSESETRPLAGLRESAARAR